MNIKYFINSNYNIIQLFQPLSLSYYHFFFTTNILISFLLLLSSSQPLLSPSLLYYRRHCYVPSHPTKRYLHRKYFM